MSPASSMFGASWLALEPRIMFDGAAVTTVDSIATEQLAQSQAESSLSPDDATAYPDAAPTGEPQFGSGDQALFDALAAYDTSAARQEIVFLSPSIRDYQRLLDNMSPNVEVFVLDPTREGVQQMTEVLADRTGIDALHLIAEGNEAELHLGTSVLTRDSLSTHYAEAFQQIGQSLSAEADMLIYGCNFGRGGAGQSAIAALANLTGADVAASTDLTGAAGLGGDWTLEVNTGAIESAIAVTMEGRAAYSHVLDTSSGLLGHWTFDTNADDSSGNNYNSTLTNGAAINTTSSTNIVGAGKVSLDGLNDFVDLTAHKANFEGLTQGTIAMWVRTTDAHMELFSLSDTADQNSLVALYVTSTGTLGFDMLENDVNILDARSVISINDGQWHHVAVTVDASGTKLYVDGAEAPVNYEDGNSASTAFFDDVTGIDVMQIGRNTNSSGHRLYYDGLIDDVRVYNRALTSVDMGELYDTGNAAPVITNLAGDSLAYSEGAGAMVIEQGGNATVSDVDSADFTGGTLTVRFTTGSDIAEDVLSIRNQGTGAGQIGVSGSSVTYGGVTIGTFTGGSGGSNLVVTLNSSATPTAVTALVRNITYENTDTGAPTTGTGTVRFVLTDGDGGTSANSDTTVTVSGVNDAPEIANLAGDSLAYSEGAGAVIVEQGGGATVSDVDSANFNSGTLTVRFTAGSDSAEDVLSIRNQGTGTGQIGVSGSSVTYGGITIGTFTGGSGGSNLVVTLNSSATPTVATALVKNITYQNTDTAAPTTGARTVRFVLTDGDGGTSANSDTTVTVSSVNDAPTITNLSGDSVAYSEGNGAVILEQGGNATVSDVDSANFNSGTLTVRFTAGSDSAEDVLSIRNQGTGAGQIGVSGSNVTYGGVTIGTFTGGSGGSNLVVTLNSSATPTAVTALVKNITYQNTDTAVPTTGARTVRFVLTDGDGGTSANSDTTVTVSGINDAPVNTVPGAQVMGEDGLLVFSAGNGNQIGISDVDAAGGMMHIALTAANGTLTLSGTTGLSFITGDGTGDGTMTFTGTVADINTALNGMGFLPALNYNGAASVQVTTDDQGNSGGAVQSDTDTVAITVTAGNDPPVNTIPGPQGTPQNTILIFSAGNGNQIGISDVDAAGGMMHITLTAANGTLTLNGTTGLSFITGDGTADGTMTFTGTVADINTTLNGMGFLPALNYNGAASVQVTTDDQGNSGGGAQGDIDTVSIIVSNNVPPVVTMSGGSLSYTENDGDVAIDTGLTVADADNATLAGATVRITGNYVNGEDLLAFTNQLGITGSWNAGTGELILSGSATLSDYQTALRSITYTNLSNAPSTSTRTVSFSVNDSGVDSAITIRMITIAAVNDPPAVNNLSGDSLAYSEDDGVVVLEQGGNATVSDVDSADFNSGTLTARFTAGTDSAEDVLAIRNQGAGAGQIGVSGSTVTYGGVTIGTFTGGTGGGNLVITLNSSATPTAVTALVKNLTYENTDTATPTTGARTVRVVLTDGDGGTSANYDTTVTVSAVDDAPVNSVPGSKV